MDLQLGGKRALVTGSSAGIGEAIAKAIAREGACVMVHGRNEERANGVADEIAAEGEAAEVVLGDLSTDAGAARVAREAGAGGPVDVLVNNAGLYELTTWDDVTTEQWEASFQADLLSAVRLIKAFMPGMRERGWGRIIQIGSGSGAQPFPTQPQYVSVKGAMLTMTVSLARYLAGTGVTSNIVTPGLVRVPSVERFYRQMNEHRGWGETWEEIEAGVVREVLPNDTGRMGTPEDVAPVVAMLASPLSCFVSGADYRVDGGSTVGIN